MPLNADKERCLVDRTKEHWDYKYADRFERYIKELLPLELAAARDRAQDNLPGGEPLDLLVLMLGHSLEPLLQSIVAYRPRNLLVVYSQDYGSRRNLKDGGTFRDQFLDLVRSACADEHLRADFQDLQCPQPINPTGRRAEHSCDDPVSVFRFLRGQLIPGLSNGVWCPAKVLIDITGAKKSMVSGAYLFAAFAGVGVTYVDFDEYDEEYQRPYGFTCRIGRLRSPARAFQLDDWKRVRHLYETSSFGAMQDALSEIADEMEEARNPGLFTDSEREAVRCIWHAAGFYYRWAEGDYRGANALWASLEKSGLNAGVAPPPAVARLAGR